MIENKASNVSQCLLIRLSEHFLAKTTVLKVSMYSNEIWEEISVKGLRRFYGAGSQNHKILQ